MTARVIFRLGSEKLVRIIAWQLEKAKLKNQLIVTNGSTEEGMCICCSDFGSL